MAETTTAEQWKQNLLDRFNKTFNRKYGPDRLTNGNLMQGSLFDRLHQMWKQVNPENKIFSEIVGVEGAARAADTGLMAGQCDSQREAGVPLTPLCQEIAGVEQDPKALQEIVERFHQEMKAERAAKGMFDGLEATFEGPKATLPHKPKEQGPSTYYGS